MKDVIYRLIQILAIFGYLFVGFFAWALSDQGFLTEILVLIIGVIVVDFLKLCLIYIISGEWEVEQTLILTKLSKDKNV